MSGLIWAGIGKGIADAGSTFANYMTKDIDDQRKREDEDRKEAAYIRRLEEADRIKSERDEAKAEALKQRISGETEQVNKRAQEIGSARNNRSLEADAARLAMSSAQEGEGGVLTKEQVLDMIKKDPALRESYRKSGLIEGAANSGRDTRLQTAEDRVQAAREIGAHSSVLDAYAKDRDATLREIKEEREKERTERRETRADEREARMGQQFTQTLGVLQQNAESNRIRAERAGSGGGSSDKPATTADLQRQITSAQNNLAQELGVSKNDVNTEIASIKRRADAGNAKAKQTLESVQPYLDELKSANDRMLEFKRNRTTPSSNTGDNSAASRGKTGKDFSNLWN